MTPTWWDKLLQSLEFNDESIDDIERLVVRTSNGGCNLSEIGNDIVPSYMDRGCNNPITFIVWTDKTIYMPEIRPDAFIGIFGSVASISRNPTSDPCVVQGVVKFASENLWSS